MSNYPFIFGARGGGGGTPSIPFSINGTEEETLTEAFNLVATLDGTPGGTYNAATDTLAFTSTGGWVRPSDWRTLPTLTAASEAGYILVFVYENRLNQFGIVAQNGRANFDWGDGTNVNSTGANQVKTYNYASIAQPVFVDPITGENYKQVIVAITRIGAALQLIYFRRGYDQQATSYGVDYNLSFPNCTDFQFPLIYYTEGRYVKIFKLWALGTMTSISMNNLSNCRVLQLPSILTGNFGTILSGLGAVDLGNLNFATTTNLSQAVVASRILSHGNLTANSTLSLLLYAYGSTVLEYFGTVTANICPSISRAWEDCVSMRSIGLLTLPLCTDYSRAFLSCVSLNAIRVANAAACTNTTSMIQNCFSLQVLDMPNLTRGVNFSTTSMGNYGMNIFANGIGTASGAQTITITGTPFGALVTAADATALAIRAVLIGKGYTIAN